MHNDVFLIAYADRLGGSFIKLERLLRNELKGCFSGVHVLPFYFPIDGADAGFDPIDHLTVDRRLGSWAELSSLSLNTNVMADVIVNHMSAQSSQFKALVAGDENYAELFLTERKVFPGGAKEGDLKAIYRPRPSDPFTRIVLSNGHEEKFWTTFSQNQIDIDVESDAGSSYLNAIINRLSSAGITYIRLDAAGYAIKRAGTDCFMLPETFDFIAAFTAKANQQGMQVLVESHAHYQDQISLAAKVDYVYDFALPPLVLHTLLTRDSEALVDWLGIAPRNAMTVLDTHDGIGIRDIGPSGQRPGLLSAPQIDRLVESVHENSAGQSRKATGEGASNLDLYQVNCTFFDALGGDEHRYLLARAIQLFSPGVPQIYYAGLLAARNDMQLLERTGVGRDINRHFYSETELKNAVDSALVKAILHLVRLRRNHPAFGGSFEVVALPKNELGLRWENATSSIALLINLETMASFIEIDEWKAPEHNGVPRRYELSVALGEAPDVF